MNERTLVLGLTALFIVTLWPVYTLENVFVWLVWGGLMVALSGAALIQLNR